MKERPIFTENMKRYVNKLRWNNYVEKVKDFEYNFICITVAIGTFLGGLIAINERDSKRSSIEQRLAPTSTNYISPIIDN